jgi:hypothetical protein
MARFLFLKHLLLIPLLENLIIKKVEFSKEKSQESAFTP